jgi:hypothetical protein
MLQCIQTLMVCQLPGFDLLLLTTWTLLPLVICSCVYTVRQCLLCLGTACAGSASAAANSRLPATDLQLCCCCCWCAYMQLYSACFAWALHWLVARLLLRGMNVPGVAWSELLAYTGYPFVLICFTTIGGFLGGGSCVCWWGEMRKGVEGPSVTTLTFSSAGVVEAHCSTGCDAPVGPNAALNARCCRAGRKGGV